MIAPSSVFYGWLLQALLRLQRFAEVPVLGRLYAAIYAAWAWNGPPVRTRLHGFAALLNRGNTYPFILRQCPTFNAPLIELVRLGAEAKGRPLTVIDVGAATGDTIFLLNERCPGAIGRAISIEGDPEFFALLQENMRQFPNVRTVSALLAREPMKARSLVKHHLGTAAALGELVVDAVTLDSIVGEEAEEIDVLKIDVDGFDGEVLAGSTTLLQKHRPIVILEWHPKLLQATGNAPFDAFTTLATHGYTSFAWFHNHGAFSHFTDGNPRETLERQHAYLLAVNHRADEHFDVVALPPGSPLSAVELAALRSTFG